MSRRRSPDGNEFGSDSFLDIIANIVGILIILIVVAGVKVARQSAIEAARPTVEPVPVADFLAVEPDPDMPTPAPADVGDRLLAGELAQREAEAARGLEAERDAEAEREWNDRVRTLTLDLAGAYSFTVATEQQLAELQQALALRQSTQAAAMETYEEQLTERQTLTESVSELRTSVTRTSQQLTSFQSVLASLTDRQARTSTALQQVSQETRSLQQTLDKLDESRPTAQRIDHRLSPVGEAASGDELHFRMAAGRIVHIPLEALLERLKAQVSARRALVMRFHRYEGLVGPVGGFRMQYLVRRDSMAPLQALQYGGSAYRVSVARWTVLPAETLEAEEISEALRIGSRFRQVLESTAPGATVTVWLYPDDFENFAKVRELAHNLNLRVAARPLPDDTPITGSPHGSRSSSQ